MTLSPKAQALLLRPRLPTATEVAGIPWLRVLPLDTRERAVAEVRVIDIARGEQVCRHGREATHWLGVVNGLLKMSSDRPDGVPMTFAGLPSGAWFSEGTVLKREPYRYNVEALRNSVVAGIPTGTFHDLLDHSIEFNRYMMQQLNERLGQFIAAREIDRMTSVEERVARSLCALFHPVLHPGVGQVLRIKQEELAYLVGLSRQRVNEALQVLQAAKLLQLEYGGVRVLDLDGLRTYAAAPSA